VRRRLPNPWVAIPVLVSTVAGFFVGFFVTDASCAPGSCTVAASMVGVVAGLAVGFGIGVVVVLAMKSLDEFRTHRDRDVTVEVDPED
jgi:hypothetical protein